MKAIDNKELILALEDLEKEKGIKKEYLLESIEAALVTAYKRNFDALENVKVVMDKQTGATYVYSIKEVVERANDPVQEISLDEAISLIKKNSRHYAKRQYTFFNNQMNIKWFNTNYEDFSLTVEEVYNYIKGE